VSSAVAGRLAKLACALAFAVVASEVAIGQAPAPAASPAKAATGTYVPPRTADGQPDISGMYEPGWIGQPAENPVGERWRPQSSANIGPTDFGAREAAEKDASREQIKQSRTPMIVDPPDGKVPMQPWVAAMRKEIYEKQNKAEFLDPRVRCLQAGVPRANMPVYYNSYQILQRPGSVIIVYEWNHMTRIIPLDGRPHVDKKIRLAMGDSRGRWDGNTLVVDVTNFNDDTWVLGHGAIGDGQPSSSATSGHGIVHSDQLHVVERYTPVSPNIIHYEARIEDPKAFTQPFTVSLDAMSRGRKDHQIFEYACHEGNRDGILMATGVDIDPSQK
jgi:hypothetical protein